MSQTSQQPPQLTPKRPYLLRAFYEWIVDNGMTPHILVDARSPQVSVPRQFVKDGSIVLNVSMTAANNLMMRDHEVTFNARFGGKAFSIYLPMWSVMAIYSRETQDGISFSPDEYAETAAPDDQTGSPFLAAVPDTDEADSDAEEIVDAEFPDAGQQDDKPEPPKPGNKQRPSFLRVVK
jgi:stringent starvation protein B